METEAEKLKSLIRARGQLRRLFTRSLSNVTSETDFVHVKDLYEKMTNFDSLIQSNLLQQASDEELEKEYDDSEAYTIKWLTLKNSFSQAAKTDREKTLSRCNINLPKLEIHKFNDDPKRWLPFWSQFQKIHEDTALENSDKFQYLIQAMEVGSSARSLVESYPPTGDNYEKVISFLKDRFARQEILVETYIRELLTLVISKNNHSVSVMYDKLVSITQTLESLGITEQKYECILYPLIESALPDNTLLAWSRVPHGNAVESKLCRLFQFLKNEVEAEGRLHMARTDILGRVSSNPSIPTANCLMTKEYKEKENNNSEGKITCYFCDKFHNSNECTRVNKLSMSERKDAIKKKGGCYICLKQGHLAKNCKAYNIKCLNCGKRHMVILCPGLNSTQQQQHSIPKTGNKDVINSLSCNNTTTLLQTLVVKIGHPGKEKKVRALLDSGSQRTYIKTGLADELSLEVTGSECLGHSLFGGVKKQSEVHKLIKFKVSTLNNSYETTMIGLENNVLCGYLPKVRDPSLIKSLQTNGITLTDANENVSDISILIGSDFLGTILEDKMFHVSNNIIACKTRLGWTIQGPMQGVYSTTVNTHLITTLQEENSLQFLWDLETLGIRDPYDKDSELTETEIINNFNDNISVNKEERYEVNLTWKLGCPQLQSNYDQAYKRLHSTTKKLESTGKITEYHAVLEEWKKEGIIEKVEEDRNDSGHYLPHHAIIKLSSSTTKIRPVFDASAKDKNSNSLNNCVEKGPNLIQMLPKLLMLFRANTYGIIADIRKAFLQIALSPQDRKYLKLLWWNDPTSKKEVVTYQHARVPFGVACSPFILAATLNYHLQKHESMYPETAPKLRESFYVDNVVTSFDTAKEIETFMVESNELMLKGKFELREWMSSLIPEDKTTSVLGLQWNLQRDDLQCNINMKNVCNGVTKRHLLSVIQQCFDPLGFYSPVTLVPKLIMQKTWLLKTGWDEKIPTELEKEYTDWLCTAHYISECRIPRRLTTAPMKECETSVHLFCDASKNAYAGCVFLRTKKGTQVTVQLIMSKSRVSPVKRQMSLPRLELMGAVIASRLYREVVESGLLSACMAYKTYCWTDSSVVWAWLKRQENWKQFVSNRVKEICLNTNKEDWFHIPGSQNPADLPSRGCTAEKLLKDTWWTGPAWLYLEKENWPKSLINIDEDTVNSEKKSCSAVHVETNSKDFSRSLLYFNQYTKIVRLVARLLRMSPRIRKEYNVTTEHIGSEEYKNAEMTLLRLTQKESYGEPKKDKKIITIEENGILKVKTRLEYSVDVDKEFIYPILLPGKHEIVQRMVQQNHIMLKHAGTQLMMSTLRNSYWITGIRRLTKKVVSQCMVCKRYTAKHYEAPEAPLPADRISSTAAFEITGIDLAGPLMLKGNHKCWIVLFTCAVYRAVHLELTDSLSTASFIMALRRFIARRGRVRKIYSDNGTNFKGTSNLLQEVNWQEVEAFTNSSNIVWTFSPPSAPWWGGWWERLIRVVKDMLRRILGKACIDWIELTTILCDCEAVINNRPLTYVEMGEMKPLTPAMFLHGLPTNDTPDIDQIDQKLNVRYNYLQQLREDFRKRFRNEYLGLLVHKRKGSRNEPKVGEIVLIETDTKRLHWPLGIIKEIFTGKDGCTRVARVKTASGDKVRAYQRLYPLEISATCKETLDMIPQTSNIPETETQHLDVTTSMDTVPGDQIPSTVTTRCGREVKLPYRFL